eukprot:357033-Chlamydomonas_euryale.AAC.8
MSGRRVPISTSRTLKRNCGRTRACLVAGEDFLPGARWEAVRARIQSQTSQTSSMRRSIERGCSGAKRRSIVPVKWREGKKD